MDNIKIDALSREKIVNDINTNYFVEAGAGSGKTTVLVSRLVRMVKEGREIDKICAITFTKAAASEFYKRFQEELAKDDDPKCKEALKNLNLCFMGTIDAFCNMVLSEHPNEAHIPSDTSMLDKDEMDNLYLREYSRILGEGYGEELSIKGNKFNNIFYNARDIFINTMPIMIGKKNVSFNYSKAEEISIEKNYKEKKDRIINLFKKLKDNPKYYEKYRNQKTLKRYYDIFENNIYILDKNWDENINDIISYLNNLLNIKFDSEFEKEYDNLFYDWRDYLVSNGKRTIYYAPNKEKNSILIEECQNYKTSIILDFLTSCIKPISETLKEEGKLTFDDYLLGVRDLLKDDIKNGGKLIKHIYDRHSYFLIDEFQDTNPLQAEIFFYLTAKEYKEDWKECIPKEGSLFIVGDPKQSIYRFRNADVSSYLKVKSLFKGEVGEVLTLTRNFRSSPILCNWFNEVFNKLLPEDTLIQSKYHDIPIDEYKLDKEVLEGVYKYHTEDKNDGPIIRDIITKIINNPNYLYYNRKKNEYFKIDYKDIMIITPTTTGIDKLLIEFKAHNIPVKVEGYVLFNECRALRSIYYLLSYFNSPDKRGEFVLNYLSDLDIDNIDLIEYYANLKDYSPSTLISKVIDDFKVFEYAGIENSEYLYFALELIRDKESNGDIISLEDCILFIRSLFEKNKDYERNMQLDEDSNRVHIANLHKVKGLERPIVFLALPDTTDKEASIRIDYSSDNPQGYFFSNSKYINGRPSIFFKSFENKKMKELEEETLEKEKDRLLYVAATRAGNALIVADKHYDDEKAHKNPWFFFTENIHNDIYDYISKDEVKEKEKEYYEPKDYYNEVIKLENNEKSYIIKLPSKIKSENKLNKEEDILLDNTREEIINDKKNNKINPTLVGTIVHRYMELLILNKDKMKNEDLIQNILKEFDLKEDYYFDILNKVSKQIHNGGYKQENDIPEDILNELLSAQEIHTEVPFSFKEDDLNIWNGVIDLLYRKDDKWHIVDYKTNADPNLLDEKYKGQLDAYIKAFKSILNEEVDALIYHIDI